MSTVNNINQNTEFFTNYVYLELQGVDAVEVQYKTDSSSQWTKVDKKGEKITVFGIGECNNTKPKDSTLWFDNFENMVGTVDGGEPLAFSDNNTTGSLAKHTVLRLDAKKLKWLDTTVRYVDVDVTCYIAGQANRQISFPLRFLGRGYGIGKH